MPKKIEKRQLTDIQLIPVPYGNHLVRLVVDDKFGIDLQPLGIVDLDEEVK